MHLQNCCFANVRASSHEPGYRDAVLPLVHMRNLIPVSEMRKGQRIPGKDFWGQIRETKQTRRKTKILNLAIIASATLKAVLYYCSKMRFL